MAKSVTIKKDNEILYPKTVSSLVYNNITGNTVAEELDNKLESSDIKTVNGTSLIGSGNITIVGEKGDKGDPLTYADLTAAQKTELARDATAAAQQAANSLSYIENAISNLDPSLSTEQAIVALTALLSVIETNVNTLTEKTDELYANRILDSDKIIKNQPLLDLYLSSDEYEVFSGGYVQYDSGLIVNNATQGYIKISNFRGNSLHIEGIKNTVGYSIGYGFFDSSDTRLSGRYYGNQNNNYTLNLDINTNAAYVLISIGEIASFDFSKMVWKIKFLPEPIYDLKSLNGILIRADSINGVATKEMEWLRNGIITKLNKLDVNLVIPGYKFDRSSQTITKDVNGVLYLLEIDNNVSKICIYGLKGTGNFIYYSTYILDEDFNVLQAKNDYGTSPKWQEHNITSLTNPKFICFNAKGAEVANNLEDVIILYDPPYDYTLDLNYYLQHSNDLKFNFHSCVDSLPINYFADTQYATRNSLSDATYSLNIPTLGGEYVTYYLPDGDYMTTNDTFVLYDENDTVISSEALNDVSTINFGYVGDKKHYFQCKLNNSCKKLYMRIALSAPEVANLTHRLHIERGNVVYVSKTRQMWWTGPKIINIDGYPLPVIQSDPLEGKTICCFGDSITHFGSSSASGGYPWLIQKKHNCAVINYARGNAHFTDVPNTDPTANTCPPASKVLDSNGYNNTVSTQVRWCIRELTEDGVVPDVIILSGCTNDGFSSKPIGDLDTALALYPMTTDAVHTDFYSLAVYLVSKIRLAFPKAKIFFGTPIRSLNATLMIKLKLYVEAFHNVAKALGIEVIDWHDESGIIEYPSSYDNNIWFNDDLHPSQLGVEAMAQLAVSKIATSLMQPR